MQCFIHETHVIFANIRYGVASEMYNLSPAVIVHLGGQQLVAILIITQGQEIEHGIQ
jgi:phage gp45-like